MQDVDWLYIRFNLIFKKRLDWVENHWFGARNLHFLSNSSILALIELDNSSVGISSLKRERTYSNSGEFFSSTLGYLLHEETNIEANNIVLT